MEKENVKKHYQFLEAKYNKSIRYENSYRKGKNKKTRESGLEKLRFEIEDLEYQAGNDQELFNLILPQSTGEPARSIFWEEFLKVQYFTRDLKEILERIQSNQNSQ